MLKVNDINVYTMAAYMRSKVFHLKFTKERSFTLIGANVQVNQLF
jgi:hypothetical protein